MIQVNVNQDAKAETLMQPQTAPKTNSMRDVMAQAMRNRVKDQIDRMHPSQTKENLEAIYADQERVRRHVEAMAA